jgi:post-segregation antitoxin (ccd killing protein)
MQAAISRLSRSASDLCAICQRVHISRDVVSKIRETSVNVSRTANLAVENNDGRSRAVPLRSRLIGRNYPRADDSRARLD